MMHENVFRSVCLAIGIGFVGCGGVANENEDPGQTTQALSDPVTIFPNPYGNGTANPTQGMTGFVKSHTSADGATHVLFQVRGLPPNREFGAHVHRLACNNNAAGGHYRNDPAGLANPENEIWLDFTTNAAGNGHAEAINDFVIRPGEARAVIVHQHGTEPGGVAGPKLACIDHDFDQ